MAPVREIFKSLLRRDDGSTLASTPVAKVANNAAHELVKRSTSSPNFGAGSKPASSFNNQGFFALFALIGAGMVLGSLWFFFWAPNGGFKWRQGDWDDYKSTVLRRKGPDGRTLSNATKSTKLGGGSVVHNGSYGRAATEAGDDESYVDEKAPSIFGHLRGGRGKRSNKSSSKARDPELANYRHEKPARVGGLNRQSDGTFFDYSATDPSSFGSEVSQKPLVKDAGNKDNKKATKDAKKEAAARQKQLAREQKEASKKQKELAAADKKREKEKAKAMKKSSTTTTTNNKKDSNSRSYSPAKSGPDTPERNRRYADEMRSEVSYSTYSGETVTEDAYTDVYTQANTASNASESYYSSYRPHAMPARPPPAARAADGPSTGSPSRSNHQQQQQRRQSRQRSSSAARHSRRQSSHHAQQQQQQSSSYSNSNSDDTGTKIYSHHIPGLSTGGGPGTIVPEESVSNVGVGPRGRAGGGGGGGARRGRDVMEGYRRSARSRRDSLSDSD
ncbi:hypothetical protein HDK77DRAFT_314054 [Phyllosticta capitalensis]|uniref:uncharacterized protein n=1 Tax=Phyllosticta capitalensis TaxID=121624 RepID=UPI00312E1FEE